MRREVGYWFRWRRWKKANGQCNRGMTAMAISVAIHFEIFGGFNFGEKMLKSHGNKRAFSQTRCSRPRVRLHHESDYKSDARHRIDRFSPNFQSLGLRPLLLPFILNEINENDGSFLLSYINTARVIFLPIDSFGPRVLLGFITLKPFYNT